MNKRTDMGYGGRGTHDILLDDQATFVHTHDESKDSVISPTGEVFTGCEEYAKASEQSSVVVNEIEAGGEPEIRKANRRTILKGMGVGAFLAASPIPRIAYAAGGSSDGNIIVAIFLRGGIDGLGAVAPLGDSNYARLRPNLGINDSTLLPLAGGGFGLHPGLSDLLPLQDKIAIVHATGHPDASRSHFVKMAAHESGVNAATMNSGWLGRYLLTSSATPATFRSFTVGASTAMMLAIPNESGLSMTSLGAIRLINTSGTGPSGPLALRDAISTAWSRVSPSLGRDSVDAAMRAVTEAGAVNARLASQPVPSGYTTSQFGGQLRQVAQLIKGNVGVEVAAVDLGGWDHHGAYGNLTTGEFGSSLKNLGANLKAFWDDLGPDWQKKVTVITMSEFGRRADQNAGGGTDHGYGNFMMVMNGDVRGGMHGSFPGLASSSLDGNGLAITTDYRDVAASVLTRKMGADSTALSQIFPDYRPSQMGLFV